MSEMRHEHPKWPSKRGLVEGIPVSEYRRIPRILINEYQGAKQMRQCSRVTLLRHADDTGEARLLADDCWLFS